MTIKPIRTIQYILLPILSLALLTGCETFSLSVDRTSQTPETVQLKKTIPMYTESCTDHTEYGPDPSCGLSGNQVCVGPVGGSSGDQSCSLEYNSCYHDVRDCHSLFDYNSDVTVTLHFDPAATLNSGETEHYKLTADDDTTFGSGNSYVMVGVNVTGSRYQYYFSTDSAHPADMKTGKIKVPLDRKVNLDVYFRKRN